MKYLNPMRMTRNMFTIFSTAIFLLISVSVAGQETTVYDQAFTKSVKKLLQYPGRTKEIAILGDNYRLACSADREYLNILLASGQPDIWLKVFNTYNKMENRQQDVKSLPGPTLEKAGISFDDLTVELAAARHKAAAYLYHHSNKLLKTGKPSDARIAYDELYQLARIDPAYPDLDKMLRRAILIGAEDIKSELQNRTGYEVDNSLTDRLSVIVGEYKKARPGPVESLGPEDGTFAFTLRVVLDDLDIGADQIREMEYTEERDIYENGRVTDTIRCSVNEYRQLKKARMTGAIEFYDRQAGRVVNRLPVSVETIFSNAYAYLQGDPRAAGEATQALLSAKKAAYPTREQMILDAAEEFARKASEVILAD